MKIEANLYYWFYGITPQTFAAIIAAIGMIAIYKLSSQREKIRIYVSNFFGFWEVKGHRGAGDRDMTIEQAIKNCESIIATKGENAQDQAYLKQFKDWKTTLKELIAERKTIIGYFTFSLILCFAMILISLSFLFYQVFASDALFGLFLGAILTICLTGFSLIKILLMD